MNTRNFLFMLALSFVAGTVSAQAQNKALGSDRDKHGCIGSAGYTYSVIKKDCIRTFEQKVQLNEIHPKGSSTSRAAVIFSDDNKMAEVFAPGIKSSVVLVRTGQQGKYKWKKGALQLEQNGQGYTLKKNNKAIFGQE
ncbi:MAG TPA: hypothetical protein VM802_14375 [Chitinophaga sp.]|uniref:hypothetical protein n=1 Tax=Chitinophaga sp. TaxID=1869181 RepID=UPI002B7E1F1D|nr:hypothetical protein [Chitinophaga sp.]HVI46058.1 hypothetical protein [Chitinophaga sp.]